MSYWGPYEDQLPGTFPAYDPEYVPYTDAAMSYYGGHDPPNYPVNSPFAVYNAQNSYRGDYYGQPGPSQVPPIDNANENREGNVRQSGDTNRNNGTVKKKLGEKSKYWNNPRKNERSGSGRTFTRGRPDYGTRNEETYRKPAGQESENLAKNVPQSNCDFEGDDGGSVSGGTRNRNKPRIDGRQNYQNSKYRGNYYEESRQSNYRGRENRFSSYESRNNYGRYPRQAGRNFENNACGTNSGRQGYRNNWRKAETMTNCKRYDAENAKKKLDAASQRERLEQMLSRRMLECLVCCEKIKHTDKIWSCQQCHLILHLDCTIAWAKSSKLDNGWRCPACQNVCSEVPKQYHCYCGKTVEPRMVPGVIPHACGEPCMRQSRACDHKCPILCHPGPCPDCNAMVSKFCGCGATQQTVKCSSDNEIICNAICNKMLSCGLHFCQSPCHGGPCDACDQTLQQICFCEKVGRRVSCTAEFQGATRYACDDVCGKVLGCGNHKCEKRCHEGPCEDCSRDVKLIKTCPCGRTELEKIRTSCLDPIPCCDKVCGKILACGQPAAPHSCKLPCHAGECPPCPLTTLVRCRCGYMDKELPCEEVTTKADDARCEKKCTKKRLCGKHRCNQRCCIEVEHICPLPCNHLLACGQHRCDRTCHSGRCPSCMETSFEELYCECGANVLYPPIPCGTRPPNCKNPCSRPRPCGHAVNHACHTGACPPCTVLCKRWCHGQHEQRSAIPCYQDDFSCGLPCGKPMPCGTHKCDKPCHLGPCQLPCKQKCNLKRLQCGHPCNVPCHKPPCPHTPCKFTVSVTCFCGLQKSSRPCIELADEYKELEMVNLKDKMTELLKDQPVDISDIVNKPKKPPTLKILDCTEECRVLERNRRLAIGLQICNPDLSQKLTPRYSDFMRGWAKKDAPFCQKIHDKLTELVQLAKQSKQKSRSHSFESMNRDKRHFVHEYCQHFGCESAAYDTEPNRNIVATAIKDKSWMPSMSLLEVVRRENGQRKVPGPVLSKGSVGKSETVSLKLPGRAPRLSSPPRETVDYFDYPPV